MEPVDVIQPTGESLALSDDELVAFLSLCAFDVKKSLRPFVIEPAHERLLATDDHGATAERVHQGIASLEARGLLGQPGCPGGAHRLVALPGMLLSAGMALDLCCLVGAAFAWHWRFAARAGSIVAYHRSGEEHLFTEAPGIDGLMQQVRHLLAPLGAIAQPGAGDCQTLPASILRKFQAQRQRKAFKTAKDTLVAGAVPAEVAAELTSYSAESTSWVASLSSPSPRNRRYPKQRWVYTVCDRGWLVEIGRGQGRIVPSDGAQCQGAILELFAQLGETYER